MSARTKTTKPSDSTAVDQYMEALKHPLADLAATLRKTILAADPNIGEDRKDCIRLVFWHGDRANDSSGFLEGEYPDGRRLAILTSAEQLHQRKKALVAALKAQLRHMA